MSALRVAMVPAGDRPTQNPVILRLAASLADLGVEVQRPRRRPRRGSVDVLHHHWPSADGQRGAPLGAALRLGRFLAIAVAHRAAGARVVWTAHNVVAHDTRFPRLERAFWWAYTRLVDGWIALSPASAEAVRAAHGRLGAVPSAVIPMGHLVGVCGPPVDRAEARRALDLPAEGRVVAHVGRIRPYKGVPALVEAFAAMGADDATLVVAGDVGDPAVEPAVARARAAGADVRLLAGRVEDAEVACVLAAADLMAYPFTGIMNSSAVILALSYGRPVLATSSPSLRDLQEAVGPERLRLLDGAVRGPDLAAALAAGPGGDGPPPIAALGEWPAIGAATLDLYHRIGADRAERTARVGAVTGRRTLLLVAPTFAPDPVVAAVRATEWARHLPEHGWDVVVATRWTEREDGTDGGEGGRPDGVVVAHVGPRAVGGLRTREPTGDLGATSVRSSRRRLKRALARMVVPDGAAPFWRARRDDVVALARRHRAAAVLTTSPPLSLHVVGRHVADAAGIPWVADLRDPYLADARFRPTGLARVTLPRHRAYERMVYGADAVIHANAVHDRAVQALHPDRADRTHVITNGYPDRLVDRLAVIPRRPVVVSAGRCDPAILPRLVTAAAARGLVVHLVGPASAEAVALAEDHPDHLVVHGRRPHDEVLDLVASATVLLASLPATQREALGLSSKLFEYVATGRPILVVNPMPADRDLLARHHPGGSRTIADPTGPEVDAALDAALDGTLAVAPEAVAAARAALGRRAGTARLAAVLDEVAAP